MAWSDEHHLTFLRGSGFLLSLVGAWDLIAEEAGHGPAHKGFVLFKESKIIAVMERHQERPRGIEGTYAVEGNRLIITSLLIDTAPEQGALEGGGFTLEGDTLTIRWLATPPTGPTPRHVDTFRRRVQLGDGAVLPPVAIYETGAPDIPPRP